MKRTIIAVAVAFTLAFSGCYGSFTLTKKIYTWNGTLGDKYVNTAVMWVLSIIPVYGSCAFIDIFILNVIEFWTGTNPIALQSTDKQEKIVKSGEKTFKVGVGNNEISIDQISGPDAGNGVTLKYDSKTHSFSLSDRRNPPVKVATLSTAGRQSMTLFLPDGRTETRELYQSASPVAALY